MVRSVTDDLGNGSGAEEDRIAALAWAEISADQGTPQADLAAERMRGELSQQERAEAERRKADFRRTIGSG